MAEKKSAKSQELVRYRVLGPVFVNGSYLDKDPSGRKPVFVDAVAGLEGKNLERADAAVDTKSAG